MPGTSTHTMTIEQMIAEENDPRQRSFLIVLNSINNSLVANTKTISVVSDKLDSHLTTFEQKAQADAELLNKGKGAWWVIVGVMGFIQVVCVVFFTAISADLKSIRAEIQSGALTDARIEARIAALEKKI